MSRFPPDARPLAHVVEVGVHVQKGQAALQTPKHSPVGGADNLVTPARRVLIRRLAEPETARVERLEALGVVGDGGELLDPPAPYTGPGNRA
jgi:hypothetical protein